MVQSQVNRRPAQVTCSAHMPRWVRLDAQMPPAYTSMDPYLCRTKTDSVLAYPGLTGIWRGGRLGKGWWRVRTKGGRQGSEPGVMPNLSLVSRAAWSSQTLFPSAQIWPPPIRKLPLPCGSIAAFPVLAQDIAQDRAACLSWHKLGLCCSCAESHVQGIFCSSTLGL